MIKLEKFEIEDCDRLISWIPDARFLLQWAGPQYSWPLDRKQIAENLNKTEGKRPERYIFKAVDSPAGDVVGHIEFIRVDYEKLTGHIGRVLIGNPSNRGKGLGKEMLSVFIDWAFGKLRLEEVTLSVFDFNAPALECYKGLGFKRFKFMRGARRFEGESWNIVRMRLQRKKGRR